MRRTTRAGRKGRTYKRKRPPLIAREPAELKKPLIIKAEEPLIQPRRESEWECWQTFNPAAIVLNGKVHFLYRAIGRDGISRFGYANSKDGFHLDERLDCPVYQHQVKQASFYSYLSGGGFGGAEDPRMVRVEGEDVIRVTYTACDSGLNVALTSIKVDDFLNKRWNWSKAILLSPQGQIHKNWVIFPEKINGKYAILHSITPKILISFLDNFESDSIAPIESYYDGLPVGQWEGGWEGVIKGAGPPPIKTKYGWLVFYHALPRSNLGEYNIGALLLDLKNPTTILCRGKEPIIKPFDIPDGVKPGIVYTSGAVVKDDKLLIYYGAADTKVCVAYANMDEFLDNLMAQRRPALEKAVVRRR